MFYGHYAANSTVTIPWSSNSAAGAAITRATNGTISIYKNAATTQRSSAAGITDSEDFDAITGCHMLSIDTSDNTDAGFYAAGNIYHVMLSAAAIDGITVSTWLGSFALGPIIANATEVEGAAAKAAINAELVDALTVDVLADSIAAHESRPTIGQALLMVTRFLLERSVSGTTVTVKKEDGSTGSYTLTLNDGDAPTAITRAT
jgi:hypothetical protein